jgi:cell division protein FtsW (lipid II flippase)
MALQRARLTLTSSQRNTELFLMAGAVAFLILAWRALSAAAVDLPEGTERVIPQFLAAALAGHVGLRIFAPRAAEQPFAIVLLLAAIGLAFVTRLAPDVAQDQVNWVTLGVVGMVATAAFSRWYGLLPQFKYTAAVAAALLLFVTGIFGETFGGARLWLNIAGQTVQTTELIKLLLLVFLAGYLAEKADVLSASRIRFAGRTYSALPYLVPLLGTWAVAMLSLALLRDLGTIAILLMLAVSALFLATGRLRFVLGGMALLAFTGALGYLAFSHAQVRIDVWLDPYSDPSGAGYQSLQSLYAFQAGGVTGEGLGLGQPTAIPAVTTDYIFSAIGEELGMAGATGVVLLFGVLVTSGLRVALSTRDDFSRLLACGVALLFGIQALVIIAGTLRLIPTTGITLPFVSYGGSSLVVNFVLLGLLLGLSDRASRQA